LQNRPTELTKAAGGVLTTRQVPAGLAPPRTLLLVLTDFMDAETSFKMATHLRLAGHPCGG